MKFLLSQKGISVDAKGPRKRTALHCAAFFGYGVLVDSLLKAGAKVEVVDDDGVTPLQEGTTLRSTQKTNSETFVMVDAHTVSFFRQHRGVVV